MRSYLSVVLGESKVSIKLTEKENKPSVKKFFGDLATALVQSNVVYFNDRPCDKKTINDIVTSVSEGYYNKHVVIKTWHKFLNFFHWKPELQRLQDRILSLSQGVTFIQEKPSPAVPPSREEEITSREPASIPAAPVEVAPVVTTHKSEPVVALEEELNILKNIIYRLWQEDRDLTPEMKNIFNTEEDPSDFIRSIMEKIPRCDVMRCWVNPGLIDFLPILLLAASLRPIHAATSFGRKNYAGFEEILPDIRDTDNIKNIIADGLKSIGKDSELGMANIRDVDPYIKVIILSLATARKCTKKQIVDTNFEKLDGKTSVYMKYVTKENIEALSEEDLTKNPLNILKVALIMINLLAIQFNSDPIDDRSWGTIATYQGKREGGYTDRSILSNEFPNRVSYPGRFSQIANFLIMAFLKVAKES